MYLNIQYFILICYQSARSSKTTDKPSEFSDLSGSPRGVEGLCFFLFFVRTAAGEKTDKIKFLQNLPKPKSNH